MSKKSIAIYIETNHLERLDMVRGVTPENKEGRMNRSAAINRIFDYVLGQSDEWLLNFLKVDEETEPNSEQITV